MRTRDVLAAIDASVIHGSAAGDPHTKARWSQMKTPSQPAASAASATRTPTWGSEYVPMFARQIPNRTDGTLESGRVEFTTRPELRGTFGMVASTHWLTSAAGMAVLERGGNAFD